jgi:Lrp/AsnC family transcriptional regulator, leucine-responsive regulatory protein
MDLDSFDLRLLALVQQDARQSTESLAAEVGLSAAAVQRRLKRLRQEGVIAATVAVVAPEAVGRPMTFVVEVSLERERADLMDGFKRLMRATPEVQQCYYVTGDTDFVVVVTARSMADYEAFTRRTFFGNPNIRRFRTSVVMDRVKVGLTVPVGEDG